MYVAVWGQNSDGQCDVPNDLGPVIAVAAGNYHTLAVTVDGTVAAWGRNSSGQCDVPAGLFGVVSVAAGYGHSLALKADGSLVAWGSSSYGLNTIPDGLSDVVEISAGNYLNVALKSDGEVVAWGSSSYSANVVPESGQGAVHISAGYGHIITLTGNGSAVGWGDDWQGQVSGPAGRSDIVSLACGDDLTLGLTRSGRVLAWGWDIYGVTDVPAELGMVNSVATGDRFAMAVQADGRLTAWGQNSDGQSDVPVGLGPVVMADGGYGHAVALVSEVAPPTFANFTTVNGVVGLPLYYQVGLLGSADSLEASFVPSGVTFNPYSATFSGIPSDRGVYNVRVSALNGGMESSTVVQFVVDLPHSYSEWRRVYYPGSEADESVSGMLVDSDFDLVPNIFEYALFRDPTLRESNPMSTTSMASDAGEHYLTLSYTRRKSMTDVRLVVEVSSDLKNWHSGYQYTFIRSIVDNGDTETVTVMDRSTVGNSIERFIRLRVEPIVAP